MADLTATVHASVAMTGPIAAMDERTVVFACGAGLSLYNSQAGSRHEYIWPGPRGISAFAVNPLTSHVFLSSRGQQPPSIGMYSYPGCELLKSFEGGTELEYTAIAASRGSDRLVGLGSITDNKAYVWDVAKGELLPGCTAAIPAPCRSVSFNPSSSRSFASSGSHGIFFWTIRRAYESFTLDHIKGQLPGVGGGGASSAPSSGADDTRDHWTCHTWTPDSKVFAANAAGEVVLFDPETGEALNVSEPAGAVVITSITLSRDHLIAGCEDGVVRWFDVKTLELVRQISIEHHLRSADESAMLPIACITPSPGFKTLFVSTAAGSLHTLMLDWASYEDPDSKEPEVDTEKVDPILDAHTEGIVSTAMLPRLTASSTIFATASADGRLRLWDYGRRRLLCRRTFPLLPSEEADDAGDGDSGEESKGTDPGGDLDGSAAGGGGKDGGADLLNPSDAEAAFAKLEDGVAAITVMTSHPRLPILAVGTSDGALRIVLVSPNESADLQGALGSADKSDPGAFATTIHCNRLHNGTLALAAFASDPSVPYLATCGSGDRMVYIVDTRVPLPAGSSEDGVLLPGRCGFQIVAYARLPEGERRAPHAIFWRGGKDGSDAEVCVVLQSSEILSIPAPPVRIGGVTLDMAPESGLPLPPPLPADQSRLIRLRGRLHVPITSVCPVTWGAGDFGYAASPADKALVVVGLGWNAGDWSSGQSVEGTTKPAMSRSHPLDSFPGHVKGVLCMSASPVTPASKDCPVLLASGGADGSIGIWAVKGQTVVARTFVQPHSSAVSGLTWTRDGRFVVSSALDGTVHITAVSGAAADAAAGGETTAGRLDVPIGEETSTLELYRAVAERVGTRASGGNSGVSAAGSLDGDDAVLGDEGAEDLAVLAPGAESSSALQRIKKQQLAQRAAEIAECKGARLAKAAAIGERLRELLEANEKAPELERLDRDEFVVDVIGRDKVVVDYDAAALARRAAIEEGMARREVVISRIVQECHESMSDQTFCVRAFQSGTVVHSFAIRKLTPEENRRLQRMITLRRVEMMELASSRDAEAGVWAGLLNEIPDDSDWIVNAGLLPATLDPTAKRMTREEIKAAADEAKEEDDGVAEDAEEDGEDADENEETEMNADFDFTKITSLMYHPAAVRTPNQRRMQIAFLQVLVREIQRRFNVTVQNLAHQKVDEIEKIESRNKRVDEILSELKEQESGFRPSLEADEEPERFLSVTDEEVGMERYITDADRKAAEEEAARKKAAADRNTDDGPERALMDMMGGTLEGKDELSKLEQELVREPWMDELTEEDMTEEQRAQLEVFQAKQQAILEEKAKHKKALELELKKLRAEIKEVIKHFDESVAAVFRDSLRVQGYIHAQELYLLRLGLSVQDRDDGLIRDRQLEDTMQDLMEAEEAAAEQHEVFLDRVRAQEGKVADMSRMDKELERGFKDSMREASGGTPLDADTMRVLVSLFKRRTTPDAQSLAKRSQAGSAAGPPIHDSASQLDPFHGTEGSISSIGAEEAALAARAEVLQPINVLDVPEAFNPNEHPAVWERLNEYRLRKIESELSLAEEQSTLQEMQVHLTQLKAELDKQRDALEKAENERDELLQAREVASANLELLISLRQGQDEMESEAVGTDYSDAVLIPREFVEVTNGQIVKLGTERVGILSRIKEFRKSISFLEWEHRYMTAKAHDEDEHYTDLHMLRVTKELQELIKGGDIAQRQRRDFERLEAKGEHMKKAHARSVSKIQRQLDKLASQVRERDAENRKLEGRRRELEEGVAMREAIHATRTGGKGTVDPAEQARARMKAVMTRRKLVDLAKAQTEEIEFLRGELDRLRQRTFPSFAHASQLRGNVDERP